MNSTDCRNCLSPGILSFFSVVYCAGFCFFISSLFFQRFLIPLNLFPISFFHYWVAVLRYFSKFTEFIFVGVQLVMQFTFQLFQECFCCFWLFTFPCDVSCSNNYCGRQRSAVVTHGAFFFSCRKRSVIYGTFSSLTFLWLQMWNFLRFILSALSVARWFDFSTAILWNKMFCWGIQNFAVKELELLWILALGIRGFFQFTSFKNNLNLARFIAFFIQKFQQRFQIIFPSSSARNAKVNPWKFYGFLILFLMLLFL